MSTTPDPVQLIADLLGRHAGTWPDQADRGAESQFLGRCLSHGVSGLVHQELKDRDDWPLDLRETLRTRSLEAALRQSLDDREVATLLPRLSAAGIAPLLLKGAAFAHLLYPRPHFRPRDDTDLLIRPEELERARTELVAIGYQEVPAHTGQLIMFQKSFRKEIVTGHWHTFDVHWKISNAHVFSETFSYDELASRAIPVAPLGPRARTLSLPDSLLHACLHRVGHHQGSPRIIWLCDIVAMATAVAARSPDEFQRLAESKGLVAVSLDGLRASRALFASAGLDQLIASLSACALRSGFEPSAELLGGVKARRRILWSDFKSQPSLRHKLQWTRENLFPPPSHLLAEGESGRIKLAVRYLKRCLKGIWRVATEGPTRR